MARQPRYLPAGHSFHITLRCNSRQFLIAKGLRRDVLLAVLAKAKQKVPHKLYAVCLMANHLHLLLRPDDASELPKLMHWIGWYSAMALNRLSGRCGHFWEGKVLRHCDCSKRSQASAEYIAVYPRQPKGSRNQERVL
jgi:REP element-mobilizing transposase RayT